MPKDGSRRSLGALCYGTVCFSDVLWAIAQRRENTSASLRGGAEVVLSHGHVLKQCRTMTVCTLSR